MSMLAVGSRPNLTSGRTAFHFSLFTFHFSLFTFHSSRFTPSDPTLASSKRPVHIRDVLRPKLFTPFPFIADARRRRITLLIALPFAALLGLAFGFHLAGRVGWPLGATLV